jgi:heme-degrading monooxygenase HmoA
MRFAGQQAAGNSERPISANGASASQEQAVLNAETIEFIAKPAQSSELRRAISDRVLPLLREHPGFINTILLTSHNEPRRLFAITFWKTSDDARHGMWDEIPLLEEMLAPLVDSCSQVHAFHVAGAPGRFDEETEVLALRPS